MDTEQTKAQVESINWFHQIDLGNGIVTPGNDASPKKLRQVQLPADLAGRTVLDIGAWDGFFSFESERRGADRVLAVDSYCWGGKGVPTQAGFNLARKTLKSRVEDLEIEVLELSPDRVGTFDIVLFLGVLYHMEFPEAALERVASLTKDLLILETHVDHLNIREPSVARYPGNELDGDASNWCGPNYPALEEMLRQVGFAEVKRVYESPLWWRAGRAAKLAAKGEASFSTACRQGRVVYHARKQSSP